MRPRELKAPFVVTLSLLGCTPEPHGNPPKPIDVAPVNPPATQTASAPPTETATTTPPPPQNDRPDYADYPRTLNSSDQAGRSIFRGWGDSVSCYVELPWPRGQPRMPGQVKTQDVPCPEPMKAAAWKECPGGVINGRKDSKDSCACFQTGNPPPIPHKVPCP